MAPQIEMLFTMSFIECIFTAPLFSKYNFSSGSFFLKNKQSNLSNDQTVIALSYLIWAQ